MSSTALNCLNWCCLQGIELMPTAALPAGVLGSRALPQQHCRRREGIRGPVGQLRGGHPRACRGGSSDMDHPGACHQGQPAGECCCEGGSWHSAISQALRGLPAEPAAWESSVRWCLCCVGTASLQQGAVQGSSAKIWVGPHGVSGRAKRLLARTRHRALPCPGSPCLQPSA